MDCQLIPPADFVNDNAGLWALLALPFAAVPAVDAIGRVLARLRTAARNEEGNRELLRKRLRRRRVDLELSQRLVLGSLLEARLQSQRQSEQVTPADLYDAVAGGAQALVLGSGGSGKSILALTLVQHAIEQSAADARRPLLDVVSLRDWKGREFGGNDWTSLLGWLADRLSRAHPTFGVSYFKQLLREQALIPCLDGLDELGSDTRREVLRAIAAYAGAGLPLVLLSRDPAATTALDTTDSSELSSRFDRYELLPPSEAALAAIGEWPSWRRFIANARQPHRAAVLLSNPLRLSVASLTWEPQERATALARAEDPEDELWSAFFARRLGPRDAPPRSSRRLAGWIALAATQRSAASFRASDLYPARAAIGLAFAVALIPVFATAWMHEQLGLGLVAAAGLALGLASRPGHRLETVVERLAPRSEGVQIAIFLSAGMLLLLAAGIVGNFLENFLRTPLDTSSGRVALWQHPLLGHGLASWWGNTGLTDVWRSALGAAALVPLTFVLAISDLRDREGFAWLISGATSRALTPAIGVIALGAGIALESVFLATAGVAPLLFWLGSGFGRAQLTVSGRVPAAGLAASCRELTEAGVLAGEDGIFRFRHAEISRHLGAEAADELTQGAGLRTLPEPASLSVLIDSRILPLALERADRLTEAILHDARRRDQLATTNRALFLYYGALRPEEALPVLNRFLGRAAAGTSSAKVHLAEVLDALGRREEADWLWAEVLEAHFEKTWLVNKWTRRQVMVGEESSARELLEERLRGKRTADTAFFSLLLAELRARFGEEREVGAAVATLDSMCRGRNLYLKHRATLERARLRAEVFGEREGAEQLLRTILVAGPLDSLKYARLAQLRFAAGDRAGAEQFGRESSSLLRWLDDPSFQLEAMLTAASACAPLAAEARRRADALARFGWSLPGREARGLGPGEGLEGLLSGGRRSTSPEPA